MWPNPQFPGNLVKFTEEIFNGKLHFLCSDWLSSIFFSPGDSHTKGLLNSLNLDPIHHIRNNWLSPIFFSPGDSHTKGLLNSLNLDPIHLIRNNWLGPIFFSLGDSHTKGLLFLLHLGLEGVTEVDTDPKGRFVSFKIIFFNARFLCLCPFRG